MKVILFSLLGIFLYALAGVLVEVKLKNVNTLTLMAMYPVIIFAAAVIMRQVTYRPDAGYDFPVGAMFGWVMVLGVIYAGADFFYVGAYTAGGDVRTITAVVVVAPVFASVIKYYWLGSVPNRWQLLSFVAAAITVALANKGMSVQN